MLTHNVEVLYVINFMLITPEEGFGRKFQFEHLMLSHFVQTYVKRAQKMLSKGLLNNNFQDTFDISLYKLTRYLLATSCSSGLKNLSAKIYNTAIYNKYAKCQQNQTKVLGSKNS